MALSRHHYKIRPREEHVTNLTVSSIKLKTNVFVVMFMLLYYISSADILRRFLNHFIIEINFLNFVRSEQQ